MDLANYTDLELKQYHAQMLKLCAFCEFGLRMGIDVCEFSQTYWGAKAAFQELQNEYEKRHPEQKQKRLQNFMGLADNLFTDKNNADYGEVEGAVSTEYFTEYDVPQKGMKRKTAKAKMIVDGEIKEIKTVEDLPMQPFDYLYAMQETALDAFAAQLPEILPPEELKTQGE